MGPIYSNIKDSDLSTPFYTFNSLTLYSFIRAGRTVNGPQVSATIAIATVVHTRSWRSWTLRLFNRVLRTSWGPIALAMYPNYIWWMIIITVLIVALLIPFLWAFRRSSKSKHILIHSLGDTCSGPRSAMRPTRSMQFSCTFSWRFFRMGVNLGRRSLMGGYILFIPMTFTMPLRPPKIDPSTSGYSSPKHSYKIWPNRDKRVSSWHTLIQGPTLAMKSAAYCLPLADLLFNRH